MNLFRRPNKELTLVELIVSIVIVVIFAVFIVGAFGVTLSGCSSEVETGESTLAEMEQTEANHERLVKAVPPPSISTSQERVNLKKRLERFNSENKVSYIYLIDYGKVMAFYTVKGKVSSVNSLLTTPDQIVTLGHAHSIGRESVITRHRVSSPDLDGSYGSNGNAIFFFTTSDIYIEWSGTYLLCDAPLKLSTPPTIVIYETPEQDK